MYQVVEIPIPVFDFNQIDDHDDTDQNDYNNTSINKTDDILQDFGNTENGAEIDDLSINNDCFNSAVVSIEQQKKGKFYSSTVVLRT